MDNTSEYLKAVKAITEEQSKIVGGDIALSLADSVDGLDFEQGAPKITGDAKTVLGNLVEKYSILFGQLSIQVSRDAVHDSAPTLDKADLPQNLQ